jgi:hypothetical protein
MKSLQRFNKILKKYGINLTLKGRCGRITV